MFGVLFVSLCVAKHVTPKPCAVIFSLSHEKKVIICCSPLHACCFLLLYWVTVYMNLKLTFTSETRFAVQLCLS